MEDTVVHFLAHNDDLPTDFGILELARVYESGCGQN